MSKRGVTYTTVAASYAVLKKAKELCSRGMKVSLMKVEASLDACAELGTNDDDKDLITIKFPHGTRYDKFVQRMMACINMAKQQPELNLDPFRFAKAGVPEEEEPEPAKAKGSFHRAEIVPFRVSDYQELDLVAVKTDDGDAAVVVSKICSILGIDDQTQIDKILDRSDWVSGVMLLHLPNDPIPRTVFTINASDLPSWLNSINPKRVKAEARFALMKLQKECTTVIREHFFGKSGMQPNTQPTAIALAIAEGIVAALEPVVTELRAISQSLVNAQNLLTGFIAGTQVAPSYAPQAPASKGPAPIPELGPEWLPVDVVRDRIHTALKNVIAQCVNKPVGKGSTKLRYRSIKSEVVYHLVKLEDKTPLVGDLTRDKSDRKWKIHERALPLLIERARYWMLNLFTCRMNEAEHELSWNGTNEPSLYRIDRKDLKARLLAAGYVPTAVELTMDNLTQRVPIAIPSLKRKH